MSGKFINTRHKDTIVSVTNNYKERIKNPYYLFMDKKPTVVTFMNKCKLNSTTDQGTGQIYSALGDESPVKYNKINGALLYGTERLAINYENGDFGLEASAIEGELIVPPNTFIPYHEDFFWIDHLDKKILFKVTDVTIDTFENGANFYKINYKLDQTQYTEEDLSNQIVDEFEMITNNIGTEFNMLLRKSEYLLVEELESIVISLKDYFNALFFDEKVQTFVYEYNCINLYDPAMIEFIINNNILTGGSKYIYVAHQLDLPKTFVLSYAKTIFRYLEKRKFQPVYNASAEMITDKYSLLATRLEDYYYVTYGEQVPYGVYELNLLPIDLEHRITNCSLYHGDDIFNIIINYFNNKRFDKASVAILENQNYDKNKRYFYSIPMVIYIIEHEIKSIMAKKQKDNI